MANTLQSSYGATIPAGYPGMVANGETSNRISRSVEDAAGMAFGAAAFRGTGDHGCTGTPAAGTFLGIVMANHGQPVVVGLAADVIPQYGSAALFDLGVIWISASVATTQGAPVYVTSGGAFTTVSSANTAIPAVFEDTNGAAGVCRIRIFSR